MYRRACHESSLRKQRATYSTDTSTNAQVDRSVLAQNSSSSADQGYHSLTIQMSLQR